MRRYFLIIYIAMFSASPNIGQVASVNISFNKDSVLIGDYLQMSITATY
jgi:hypothetical protein